MKLHFTRSAVQRLLAHTQAAANHRPSYVERFGDIQPKAGLWLVGDQGIYLMSNGDPPLPYDGTHVTYAREINPDTMPFEDWWANRRKAWGGDDGIEVIAADLVERALAADPGDLVIECTPQQITLFVINH